MLARLLYSLLWTLALPFVLLRLVWRARRQPAYLKHVGERFGRYRAATPGRLIWVHAVSVGETRAAEPLIRALMARWPDHSVLITHMTPTGRATSKALFRDDVRVLRAYLPYDLGWLVHRFLRHFRPDFGLVMETELWPNLLAGCRKRGVPVMLANARLSARSARRYARLPGLTALTLGALDAVGAQTAADAERLITLGARQVTVTGNIKFDVAPTDAARALGERFRAALGLRPLILAASTREGEEALLVDAFARLAPANALLLLVPRHPQRFDEVETLVQARGLSMQRRSALEAEGEVESATRVWLGDSMGEMFAYFSVADLALIGGSWLPYGGQNLIEACAVGTPVLIGPHTFNFSTVAEQAVAVGAALRCVDVDEAMNTASALLGDDTRRATMASAGLAFSAADRGASARTLERVEAMLAAADSALK